jgi:hypothetical protein
LLIFQAPLWFRISWVWFPRSSKTLLSPHSKSHLYMKKERKKERLHNNHGLLLGIKKSGGLEFSLEL